MRFFKYTVLLASALLLACGDDWRGLEIRPEHRCSPYNRSDYRYSPDVEPVIIKELGGIYSPYTGHYFSTAREVNIEHMVAMSEAHDSGLCAADAATRRLFASDLLNLTLASPELNSVKRAKDAAEWLPQQNQCWFAARVVEVRRKYGLTIDRREADALERVLMACDSTTLIRPVTALTEPDETPLELDMAAVGDAEPAEPEPADMPLAHSEGDALSLWDDNDNGRITCSEARRHNIAPVQRGHPAYPFMRDGDGDGVVCE